MLFTLFIKPIPMSSRLQYVKTLIETTTYKQISFSSFPSILHLSNLGEICEKREE